MLPLSKDAVIQQLGSMQVQLKDELDLALARADLSQVNEVALMYASLINMASKNGSAGYYAWVVCILLYLTTYIHSCYANLFICVRNYRCQEFIFRLTILFDVRSEVRLWYPYAWVKRFDIVMLHGWLIRKCNIPGAWMKTYYDYVLKI